MGCEATLEGRTWGGRDDTIACRSRLEARMSADPEERGRLNERDARFGREEVEVQGEQPEVEEDGRKFLNNSSFGDVGRRLIEEIDLLSSTRSGVNKTLIFLRPHTKSALNKSRLKSTRVTLSNISWG